MRLFGCVATAAAVGAALLWLAVGPFARPPAPGFSVEPAHYQAGGVPAGRETSVVFKAVNASSRPVRVVGLGTC
jgi:hypothetical protein